LRGTSRVSHRPRRHRIRGVSNGSGDERARNSPPVVSHRMRGVSNGSGNERARNSPLVVSSSGHVIPTLAVCIAFTVQVISPHFATRAPLIPRVLLFFFPVRILLVPSITFPVPLCVLLLPPWVPLIPPWVLRPHSRGFLAPRRVLLLPTPDISRVLLLSSFFLLALFRLSRYMHRILSRTPSRALLRMSGCAISRVHERVEDHALRLRISFSLITERDIRVMASEGNACWRAVSCARGLTRGLSRGLSRGVTRGLTRGLRRRWWGEVPAICPGFCIPSLPARRTSGHTRVLPGTGWRHHRRRCRGRGRLLWCHMS
jgi:hypothetical protein